MSYLFHLVPDWEWSTNSTKYIYLGYTPIDVRGVRPENDTNIIYLTFF